MGQIFHGCATTTKTIRRATQNSQESLPLVEGDKPARKVFKSYPNGYFHIDIAEVRTAEGKLYLFLTDRPYGTLRKIGSDH